MRRENQWHFVVAVCWHDTYNIPGLIKSYGGGQTFLLKQLKLWSVPHTKLFYDFNSFMD